jgi:hypothetical protein
MAYFHLTQKERVLHNYSITNLMYNNVSKIIQEFIFNNEDICDDASYLGGTQGHVY